MSRKPERRWCVVDYLPPIPIKAGCPMCGRACYIKIVPEVAARWLSALYQHPSYYHCDECRCIWHEEVGYVL